MQGHPDRWSGALSFIGATCTAPREAIRNQWHRAHEPHVAKKAQALVALDHLLLEEHGDVTGLRGHRVLVVAHALPSMIASCFAACSSRSACCIACSTMARQGSRSRPVQRSKRVCSKGTCGSVPHSRSVHSRSRQGPQWPWPSRNVVH